MNKNISEQKEIKLAYMVNNIPLVNCFNEKECNDMLLDTCTNKKYYVDLPKYDHTNSGMIDRLQLVLKIKSSDKIDCMLSDTQLIHCISLFIGGYNIESIYGRNFDVVKKMYKTDIITIKVNEVSGTDMIIDDYDSCKTIKMIYIDLPFNVIGCNNIIKLSPYYLTRIGIEFGNYDVNEISLIDNYLRINYVPDNKSLDVKHPIQLCDLINIPNRRRLILLPDVDGLHHQYVKSDQVSLFGKPFKWKYNVPFNGYIKLIYFMMFDKNGRRIIDPNLIKSVSIQVENNDLYNYGQCELLYISKKVIGIDGVYCIPFITPEQLTYDTFQINLSPLFYTSNYMINLLVNFGETYIGDCECDIFGLTYYQYKKDLNTGRLIESCRGLPNLY